MGDSLQKYGGCKGEERQKQEDWGECMRQDNCSCEGGMGSEQRCVEGLNMGQTLAKHQRSNQNTNNYYQYYC